MFHGVVGSFMASISLCSPYSCRTLTVGWRTMTVRHRLFIISSQPQVAITKYVPPDSSSVSPLSSSLPHYHYQPAAALSPMPIVHQPVIVHNISLRPVGGDNSASPSAPSSQRLLTGTTVPFGATPSPTSCCIRGSRRRPFLADPPSYSGELLLDDFFFF
jgi:hypothetical protein